MLLGTRGPGAHPRATASCFAAIVNDLLPFLVPDADGQDPPGDGDVTMLSP